MDAAPYTFRHNNTIHNIQSDYNIAIIKRLL